MRTVLALLLFTGFAGLASGQTLKKTSDKPTVFSSGAIVVPGTTFEKVVLTTEGKGEIAWDYEDSFSEKQSEICDGGRKLVLFPTKAGSYRIKLILWDEKKLQQILVVVSDNPNPPIPIPVPPIPVPPTPDDGKFGLVKASREGLAKVVSPNKIDERTRLLGALKLFAAKVGNGSFATPNAILEEWRTVNNAAVDKASWAAWGQVVSPVLQQAYKDGKFPTNSDWAAAFNEIAKGLE